MLFDIFNILLMIVLIICCITDFKGRKIYNKVIFPSLGVALLLHLIINGFNGLKFSFIGFLIGMAILLIPFALGGFGAGDVKLLGIIGAIKGGIFAFNTAIYMAIIGGATALVIIIAHRETINFFKSLFWWFCGLFMGNRFKLEFPTTPLLKKFPYSAAIAGGAVICILFKGAGIL